MNIRHKVTSSNYILYYMKYTIINDDTEYYMPLLITPDNTPISVYGMPLKYVRTGIFCSKPWDYKKYAFFYPDDTYVKQICRATGNDKENYIFMGKSYKDIWPFNELKKIPAKNKIKFVLY